MTGPEHYKESEKIIDKVDAEMGRLAEVPSTSREKGAFLAALPLSYALAQVHATLALVAATVSNGIKVYDEDSEHWREVLSP